MIMKGVMRLEQLEKVFVVLALEGFKMRLGCSSTLLILGNHL
jgi:hypothetical protein